MQSFNMYVELTDIFDSAFYRKSTVIADIKNGPDVKGHITIDKDLEVDWCPTGNFDTDPVAHYKKVTAFPRELKQLMKENKKWRDDKRVRVTQENNFIVQTATTESEVVILSKCKTLADVVKIIEKYM